MLDDALAWREILNARRYARTPAFIPGIILGESPPPKKQLTVPPTAAKLCALNFLRPGQRITNISRGFAERTRP